MLFNVNYAQVFLSAINTIPLHINHRNRQKPIKNYYSSIIIFLLLSITLYYLITCIQIILANLWYSIEYILYYWTVVRRFNYLSERNSFPPLIIMFIVIMSRTQLIQCLTIGNLKIELDPLNMTIINSSILSNDKELAVYAYALPLFGSYDLEDFYYYDNSRNNLSKTIINMVTESKTTSKPKFFDSDIYSLTSIDEKRDVFRVKSRETNIFESSKIPSILFSQAINLNIGDRICQWNIKNKMCYKIKQMTNPSKNGFNFDNPDKLNNYISHQDIIINNTNNAQYFYSQKPNFPHLFIPARLKFKENALYIHNKTSSIFKPLVNTGNSSNSSNRYISYSDVPFKDNNRLTTDNIESKIFDLFDASLKPKIFMPSIPNIDTKDKINKLRELKLNRPTFMLHNKCSNREVQIFGRRVNAKASLHTRHKYKFAQLYSEPSKKHGRIRIKSAKTGYYVCFDRQARLIARMRPARSLCDFAELYDHSYIKFRSVYDSSWYLGFDESGHPLIGITHNSAGISNEKCYNFIKRKRSVPKPNTYHIPMPSSHQNPISSDTINMDIPFLKPSLFSRLFGLPHRLKKFDDQIYTNNDKAFSANHARKNAPITEFNAEHNDNKQTILDKRSNINSKSSSHFNIAIKKNISDTITNFIFTNNADIAVNNTLYENTDQFKVETFKNFTNQDVQAKSFHHIGSLILKEIAKIRAPDLTKKDGLKSYDNVARYFENFILNKSRINDSTDYYDDYYTDIDK